MKNLPAPSRASDRLDLKKAIRRYQYAGVQKGHKITDDEVEAIIAIYDKYEESSGAYSNEFKGNSLPESLLEEVYAAYEKTHQGRPLYSIRELLIKDVDLCPICGINQATELDHHLPRSVFKPLAIHTRNLVPMCHDCNFAKLAGFNEEGAGFLHPYYDVLPDIDFLHANVHLEETALAVTFAIKAEAALPDSYYDRLSEQMLELKLNDRYQQELNNYISSHAVTLHLTYNSTGQNGLKKILHLQMLYERNAFHRNHWRPVLLRALSNHHEFTNGGFATILPIPENMLGDLAG